MARAGHLLGSSRLERFQDERRLLGVFVPLAVAHLRSFAIAKLMLNPACRSFLAPLSAALLLHNNYARHSALYRAS